jgi:tetratricopeptide (TPR) repeat protein
MPAHLNLALVAAILVLSGCARSGTPTPRSAAIEPTDTAAATAGAMASLPHSTAAWAHGAQLFPGLGDGHRRITTTSAQAQSFFDQGMSLMWGFNHDEATRSFAKAAELDPHCAACYWGVSLTVGPNYNLPFLTEARAKVAFEALQLAAANAASSSPVEQALIAALAKRYPSARPLDPTSALPILAAYSAAMKAVAAAFPDDLDVATLYAESLMNLHAWKLWSSDGQPAPGTAEIVATLEAVLKRDPRHAGANHYYVHTLEASPHPEKALASADRLRDLVPGAGHLVHMPAHILQRIGRYEDAAQANRLAARADEAYTARSHPPDYYPVMYTAHNHQFRAYATAMEGRRAETLEAADASRATVQDAMLLEMPGADWYVAELYTARVRFGLWDELLALPLPSAKLPGLMTGYLFGRTVAQAATGRLPDAKQSLATLQEFAATVAPDAGAGQNTLRDILAIAVPVAAARIAGAERDATAEVALLRQAVAAEDGIAYDEPKNWFVPVRHLLGAALLRTGKAREAERVYREDLRQNPENGWSLHGLAAALRAQGKVAEAAVTERRFRVAWAHADVELTSSAM